ncbi:hypothetical protein EP12_00405 [Alteromonas australica]|mgnify:CR=1 FL=1|jgi:ribosome maturation protein Sdo1|uniref:hypothetical protein n=1 Tax=Alteromonas australica TaxID=589873 RepID=UPI0005C3F18E|nr:hypothetical protein [Alteromonas australica]AJP42402.1 hypothetical protein EP12_00405 [Alteromonas australica]MAO29625.1 hypothetical protein [Alteromonas sp.]|tara:strand:+ start:539 stop:2581 length:2043 start_codon:yes stop_codon:yes gene_type:complete
MLRLPFLISDFNRELVSLLIKQCFGATFPDIHKKRQVNYLFNYLDQLNAKTVICESDYVDREYLEDFSSYYVKCFSNYSSRCARLHFFSSEFSHENFRCLLEKRPTNEVKENSSSIFTEQHLSDTYLGFVVIKPLPMTFIGRTCLKKYEYLNEIGKKFAISRKYKANLFGINLKVESVAFQEQDKVVAACATTALWTSLHASAKITDVKSIPSPSEITLNALSDLPLSINGFPNTGLTATEVIRALEKSKLKHHQVPIDHIDDEAPRLLFDAISSYIDSGIPLLLGVKVFDDSECKGDHLISILGYQAEDKHEGLANGLYLHDDRVGPYAKAELGKGKCANDAIEKDSLWFTLTTKNEQKIEKTEYLVPNSLIVATYHKIRIPFWYIFYTAKQFEHQLRRIVNVAKVKDKELDISIKISLKESSEIKGQLRKEENLSNSYDLLVSHWPRFVWVLSFNISNKPAFDFLYDATDIPQGNAFVDSIIYHEEYYKALTRQLIALLKFLREEDPEGSRDMESFFTQTLFSLKQEESQFYSYLDSNFGDLRPPKYLKSKEFDDIDLAIQKNRTILRPSLPKDGFIELFKGKTNLIWVISEHGDLIVGFDETNSGHPTLTGARPARIAGEIRKINDNDFEINYYSGRYSNHYPEAQKDVYLNNVKEKFAELFYKSSYSFVITKKKFS